MSNGEARPVMLYYDPHPAHESMASAIGAEMVESEKGGPHRRVWAAATRNFSDRPVLVEGGQPLFEAAWMKIFGHCGPVIHLAADETLMNIASGVDHYSKSEYVAHWWAHRYVDAVIAVSPRLMSDARVLGVDVIRLAHPFPEEWKWRMLGDIEPDLSSNRILAVGSGRPKNNFELLQPIAERMEYDVQFDIIGPGTDEIVNSDDVTAHGFVSEEEFIQFFETAAGFILPAVSQPFPVSTLEALRAGLPPFVSTETGTAPYIQRVDPHLVQGVGVHGFAQSLDWYFGLDEEQRNQLGRDSRNIAEMFNPIEGRRTFKRVYNQVMDGLSYDTD